MITTSSSNEDLNEFDARVFILIGQSLSTFINVNEEEEDHKKLNQDILNFESEKAEKNLELNNLIEISTKLTSKIKENERLLEKEKEKFKLFSSERKLIKIIEEDTQIYNDIFAKISESSGDVIRCSDKSTIRALDIELIVYICFDVNCLGAFGSTFNVVADVWYCDNDLL